MSFKQFHKHGGYTASRSVSTDDLSVWSKALALPDTGAELAAKGAPTSVQTAVASGCKFKFTFKDGSTVVVWKSLKNVISILNHET